MLSVPAHQRRYGPADELVGHVRRYDPAAITTLLASCGLTCLYLTYYSRGDTRKRGMALLQFTAAYRTAGFELAAGELPDHLSVLCEFTAPAPGRPARRGWEPVRRPGQ